MRTWFKATKVFAFSSLIFSGMFSASGQTGANASIYTMPAGTRITVRMDNEINSRVSAPNDTFTATVVRPIDVRGVVVLPEGAVIEGRIRSVERAGVGRRNGRLSVSFETLTLESGQRRQIEAVLKNDPVRSEYRHTAVTAIVGGLASGALIGAAVAGPGGTIIGAGIGTGIGIGAVFLRKGQEARIRAEERFEIELTRQVTLPVIDY